jgi:uncharacterized metal-binding protein
MANQLAVDLDREGVAEMSCIAGVGGDVAPLVRTATSGRPVVVIDGCPLACARECLKRHGVTPALHIELTALGVKKVVHVDYDRFEAATIKRRIKDDVHALECSDAVSSR